MRPKREPTWVRDGSLVSTGHYEIDLRDKSGSRWITVKGGSDRSVEMLAARLLDLLNAPNV